MSGCFTAAVNPQRSPEPKQILAHVQASSSGPANTFHGEHCRGSSRIAVLPRSYQHLPCLIGRRRSVRLLDVAVAGSFLALPRCLRIQRSFLQLAVRFAMVVLLELWLSHLWHSLTSNPRMTYVRTAGDHGHRSAVHLHCTGCCRAHKPVLHYVEYLSLGLCCGICPGHTRGLPQGLLRAVAR